MKKTLFLVFFVLIAVVKLQAAQDSTKVLFIGNSLTYFNDMPYIFGAIANNKGQAVSLSMYAPGGSGILNHYVDPNVYSLISNNKWDMIVIQPGTGESAGASNPVDTTVKRASMILDSVYYYNPCTKVYLYEIPYGVPSATDYATYFGVQAMIRDSVTKMADALHLQMIPAGECTRAYYSMYPNLFLHGSYNDVHPNANGSYLVALAMYTGIYQDTVSNCTYYASIAQDSALEFFSIVDTVVLNHLSAWRINTYNLHAAFTFGVDGANVAFNNLSANYDSLAWDFGDGNVSNVINPNHTYSINGAYPIKLYAYKNSCVDSVQKQVSMVVEGVSKNNKSDELTIYPNPVKDKLTIVTNFNSAQELEIINLIGQIIYTAPVIGTKATVNTNAFPKGIYIIKLSTAKETMVRKFVKE